MSTLPSRAKRKSRAERAAEIGRTAREIARYDGLDAITLRAIALRIGVTSALVSHYQPSMEGLVASTFGSIVSAELAEVQRELAAMPSAVEALRALIRDLLGPERSTVTSLWLDAWSVARRNAALAREVAVQMDAWQEFLVSVLNRGCARGEFAVADPGALAWQLLAIIDGLDAHAVMHHGDARDQRDLVRTIAEHELGLPTGTLAPAYLIDRGRPLKGTSH
ncbi:MULTISPECIES: TetR/AcrR family transcriptional regulator [unclassified Cryobacterium]|uniref:TetR/AcrR family transcriptional regulator n=1 Tax=unclassified Cryobacterium TaxID=2649013 RepID=UPI002AB4DE86|nr:MULTISPECIES: TetR family transcriptional regulator C-terminal domain-containing protein [Cryobacterium]MDY7526376.1 TetR family transcriptional regulator C-terminal domain-containing protein [Cryobacterium sp. 10C2]MDY7557819.1 TetR family transcriptional regulator C-terminal domain-containing protein [Cryobacterium sp. 10C3]MEB0004194.1 TetR family transcriptional regulator C-terminal domain-containing protein [Cryobacterium sp. RTC2.1]MEB0203358.1 TetR family transcriptional regulator C-t